MTVKTGNPAGDTAGTTPTGDEGAAAGGTDKNPTGDNPAGSGWEWWGSWGAWAWWDWGAWWWDDANKGNVPYSRLKSVVDEKNERKSKYEAREKADADAKAAAEQAALEAKGDYETVISQKDQTIADLQQKLQGTTETVAKLNTFVDFEADRQYNLLYENATDEQKAVLSAQKENMSSEQVLGNIPTRGVLIWAATKATPAATRTGWGSLPQGGDQDPDAKLNAKGTDARRDRQKSYFDSLPKTIGTPAVS